MKVELSEQDIRLTQAIIENADIKGGAALRVAILLQTYQAALQAALQPNKDGARDEPIPEEAPAEEPAE